MWSRVAVLLLSVAAAVSGYGRDAAEGDWRMTGSGVEFAVTQSATEADVLDLTLLHAEDMSLLPGTHIGTMRRTPESGRYVARIAVNPSGAKGRRMRNVLVKFTDEGSLIFEPYRSGKRISLWRWIPYLFRVTVIEDGREPAGINGAVRLGADDLGRHRVL